MTRARTSRSTTRRPRNPPRRPVFERLADTLADFTGRLFVRLGAGLISLLALLLWPIRLKLITLGAAVIGFWLGMRDEFRLIREEWRQEREEHRRLAKLIEDEWERRGLTSPEARAREVKGATTGTAEYPGKPRSEVLRLAALEAIERDRGGVRH